MFDQLLRLHSEPGPAVDEATARISLADSFAKLGEEHRFTPGDMICGKQGLWQTTNFLGGVGIFIRYLDAPEFARMLQLIETISPGNPLATIDFDCIVGILSKNGGMRECLLLSRYYEPAGEVRTNV